MMKKTWKCCTSKMTALLVAIVCTALGAGAQQRDFSGHWQVDTLKSNFAGFSSQSAALEMDVTQKNDQVSVRRHQVIGDTDLDYTENMGFDNKPVSTAISEDVTRTSKVKWSADGLDLIEESDYSIGQWATETWSLSDDGKILTVHKDLGANGKKVSMVFVYDKKN